MTYLEEQGIKPKGFKGFKSNRFGCIAQTDKDFMAMKESVCNFFESCVDINSNKLVLAVSTYLESEWFHLCCEVYAEVGDLFIFPLMKLLGKDDTTKIGANTTWHDVR